VPLLGSEYQIPDPEELERAGYDHKERVQLENFGSALRNVGDPIKRCEIGREFLRTLWPDELEYISKTHWIATKQAGVRARLVPNPTQTKFYKDVVLKCREENLPVRGIILKARQLGFSTFIQSWQYEQADRHDLRVSATVSYDDASTKEMFNKAHMIHRCMWFPRPTTSSRRGSISFDNDSAFHTFTAGNMRAGRSYTFHNVHISELPMWDNPQETMTGITDCVPATPGTCMVIESTARGAMGEFYDRWCDAERGRSNFIPFFAPWFWHEEYSMEFPSEDHKRLFGRELSNKDRAYMEKHRISLEQMRWRAWKISEHKGERRRFQQEYPAEPAEAFLASGFPVFEPEMVMSLRSNAAKPMFVGEVGMAP